jgi:hypothetical protein
MIACYNLEVNQWSLTLNLRLTYSSKTIVMTAVSLEQSWRSAGSSSEGGINSGVCETHCVS